MATGEYTSVRSQNESVAAEVEVEAVELRRHPDAEASELAEAYVRRGVHPDTARDMAAQLHADPAEALRLHAQEELGVDPTDLPSPWTAASSSFLCFSVGALLPLLTYLLGLDSLPVALTVAGVALFTAGAVTSRFTNRGALYSGLRQLALGALAAAVTYGVGHLIGAQTA